MCGSYDKNIHNEPISTDEFLGVITAYCYYIHQEDHPYSLVDEASLHMNPNYYNTNQRSKKPFIIVGLVLSLLIIAFLVRGRYDQNQLAKMDTYKHGVFSINIPKGFSPTVKASGSVLTYGESKGGDEISIVRYAKRTETLTPESLSKLATSPNESSSNKEVKATVAVTNNTPSVKITNPSSSRTELYVFGEDYVWLVALKFAEKDSIISGVSQLIFDSFRLSGDQESQVKQ